MINGISEYPDLEKRLAAELAFSKSRNNGKCNDCKQRQIFQKFKSLVELRKKRDSKRR